MTMDPMMPLSSAVSLRLTDAWCWDTLPASMMTPLPHDVATDLAGVYTESCYRSSMGELLAYYHVRGWKLSLTTDCTRYTIPQSQLAFFILLI